MADLPISGLPNLTASTNNSLIAVVASGVTYNIDILSNGFKLKQSYTALNANGSTFIYAAFAESPFKYSLAR